MNIFKKIIVLAIITLFSHSLSADVGYRIAKKSDIPKLLVLLENIAQTPEDSAKLVVFPSHVRREILERTIVQGRLFVAENKLDRSIISFLKLYLIDNPIELEDLYKNELRCKDSDRYNAKPLSVQSFSIFRESIDFSNPYEGDCIGSPDIPCASVLYYGGAYTIPEMRGKRHGSLLLRYAFSSIRDMVAFHVRRNQSNQLILTYGQVIDNQQNTLMRRMLVEEIGHLHAKLGIPSQDMVKIAHYTYLAYMPAFTEDMSVLPDDPSREGRGNLVVYNLPNSKLSASD